MQKKDLIKLFLSNITGEISWEKKSARFEREREREKEKERNKIKKIVWIFWWETRVELDLTLTCSRELFGKGKTIVASRGALRGQTRLANHWPSNRQLPKSKVFVIWIYACRQVRSFLLVLLLHSQPRVQRADAHCCRKHGSEEGRGRENRRSDNQMLVSRWTMTCVYFEWKPCGAVVESLSYPSDTIFQHVTYSRPSPNSSFYFCMQKKFSSAN